MFINLFFLTKNFNQNKFFLNSKFKLFKNISKSLIIIANIVYIIFINFSLIKNDVNNYYFKDLKDRIINFLSFNIGLSNIKT